MNLQKISLINFKNYENLDIDFSSKINCIIGNNGTGKTNLLDAIYYLSFSKSFISNIDSRNIKFDNNFFVIQGKYQRDNEIENIYCGLKKGKKKQFKRNNKNYIKMSEHIGLLPLVLISPKDSSLISDSSEERRKLINSVISQHDKAYLQNIIKYNRVLSQRNKLLKDFANTNSFNSDLLDFWDEQLVVLGNIIFAKRSEFIKNLKPIFQKYYTIISSNNELVELQYKSQLMDLKFSDLIKNSIEKDRILMYTSTGIHRDELLMKIGKHPLKYTASQGQQKTFLIALKLAQFEYLKNINNIKPILLFDDIFDKLDSKRVEQIIKLVSLENFGQIFITDTNSLNLANMIENYQILDYKIFKIENNNVELSSSL